MHLKDKVALITGGGSRIGAAIAKRFVAEGAQVCITGRRAEKLDRLLESLPPGTAVRCAGDISQPEDVKRMVETALTFQDRIDVLVNSAGVSIPGSVTEVDFADWKKTFEVNVNGPFMLMREVIPTMIKGGGGSIINISSLASLRCIHEASAYCASKAALTMLTQQAALDYGPYNIRCNVICPGFIYSGMTEGHFKELAENLGTNMEIFVEKALKDVPLRQPASPDKVAGICSFLASDDASYLTGIVIPIDGGTAIVDVFGAAVNRTIGEMGHGVEVYRSESKRRI